MSSELDALYRSELTDFVAERNRLAKQYKKDGDKELAERVAALRKPTKNAWALNQVVYDNVDDVKLMISEAERLRAAQRDLLEGNQGGDFRAVQRKFREV